MKTQTIPNAGEEMKQQEISFMAGGNRWNKMVQPL